jgi:shikimate dehydrogenase
VISGRTPVYGLIGTPVAHSLSPGLHNRWFADAGIDAAYVAFDTADPRAPAHAFALGVAGLNVTTPLKAAALASAASADADAARVGAANVLVRTPRGWHAANTDVEGLCRALEAAGVQIALRRAVILGAGGAARAAAVGLAARGATVDVLARRPEEAARVAALVGGGAGAIDDAGVAGRDLVIVATKGRAEAVAALDPGRLAPGAAWMDLNYWDPDPPGFAAARAAGCAVVDGWGMLVQQAALAFERWTGVAPDLGQIPGPSRLPGAG